jgi:hypothetical protein
MRKRVAAALGAILLAGVIVIERHAAAHFLLTRVVSLATGYDVSFAQQRIGASHAAFIGVDVSRGGRSLLAARRIDVWYSLRDLLPGSKRRFGLVGIAVDHPVLSLVKYSDGSFNVPIPRAGPSLPAIAPAPDAVPITFFVRVVDANGSLHAYGPPGVPPATLGLRNVNAWAAVDSAAVTKYAVRGSFVERATEPFALRGTVDAIRGYAMHRLTAAVFPMQSLANALISSRDVRVLGGAARSFEAEIFAVARKPDGSFDYHAALHFELTGGKLALVGLIRPLENISGHIALFDQTFYVNAVRATLAGIPMRAEGAIYDFSHPQIRIGVDGDGDMNQLRTAFRFSADQPLAGPIGLGILVAGSLSDPTVVARAASRQIRYRGFPFDDLRAGVQYNHDVLSLSPLEARYGAIAAVGRGTLTIGEHVHERMLLRFEARADRLPYAGAILGTRPLLGDAVVDGNDLLLRVTGTLSTPRARQAAALFDFEPNGVANVAPFWMKQGNGELAAGYQIDRPNGTSAFWFFADNLAIDAAASHGALPGVMLPGMPPLTGHVATFSLLGGGSTSAIVLAGRVVANAASIESVPFDSLNATFNGRFGAAVIPSIDAAGPWGRFRGSGMLAAGGVLARGSVAGSLDALHPMIPSIAARGKVSGEIGIGVSSSGIVVQASGLHASGAELAGIPVTSADGTLRYENGRIDVYSAHVQAAGGDFVAAGRYPDSLAFVASALDADAFRAFGLPVSGGKLSALGSLEGGPSLPSFDGNVSVADVRAQNVPLSGNAGIRFSPSGIRLDDVIARVDGVNAYAAGAITLAPTTRYDLTAEIPAADIASILSQIPVHTYPVTGTFDAKVAIAGSSSAPLVSGSVGIPAGSLNGLDFLDARADFSGAPGAAALSNGGVTVGGTSADFGASVRQRVLSFDLRAPTADLSDFNDFFDTGDTLGGSGSVALSVVASPWELDTSGDVDVRALRYRSLPIGDTLATWSSRKNVLNGRLAVGGPEGLLRAHGSVAFSPAATLPLTLKRSRYDVVASVDSLDLGLWAAAAGYPQIPITGRAFGSATMIGRYPQLRLSGTASLRNGTIGRFPITSFDMSFGSQGRRLVIGNATLQGPGITVAASGSTGLRASDPIDLKVAASTDDLPVLMRQLVSASIPPIRGSFAASVRLSGVVASPIFDASFSGQNVDAAGVPIESIFGDVSLLGSKLVLHNAGATFARGSATLSGNLPIRLRPFGLPSATPVSFTLNATGVDASTFNAIFGHNTSLGGLLDIHVALAGTVEHPSMSGALSIAKGSYKSDLDLVPVNDVTGSIFLNGSTITIQRFHAYAGTGRIDLSGYADLSGNDGPRISASLKARGAQFASPDFGSATIDANLSLARRSGNALLSGSTTISNATLPFSLFLGTGAGSGGAPSVPIGFDVNLKAGQNVRVRGNGYGAGMDFSGTGSAVLAGTLSAPTLNGSFTSTSGSLTYIDRAFRLIDGSVVFTPSEGVLPTIAASAITTVVNPDPDIARNPYGTASITINVSGPIDDLGITFASDPSGYSQQQIIAMLAPLGGFVSGIQFPNPYEVQIPGGAAPAVSNAPLPGGVFVQRNGTITVSQEAFNILNAQFGQALLAPVANVLGEALGVSDVNLTLGYFGNIGISVRRVLGKAVSAVYQSTFGVPSFQSFGIRIDPDTSNAASLSFYYESGTTRLFQTPGTVFGPVLYGQPLEGQSGFSFDFRHFF